MKVGDFVRYDKLPWTFGMVVKYYNLVDVLWFDKAGVLRGYEEYVLIPIKEKDA